MTNNDIASPRAAAVLWPVLIISAAVNVAGNFTGLANPIRIAVGVIATVSLVLLIVHYVRRRRA
ncbi:hypothetical protein [Amycolatopsis tolypomycina]|uniref:hypothetical protein n=1 Tax=Amycolatopsis tolypomycina TaxID=208445 RepID=UPI0033BD43A4